MLNNLKKIISKYLPERITKSLYYLHEHFIIFFYNVIPNKYHFPLYFYFNRSLHDLEMLYITKLLKQKRTFIDIGSNVGIFSYYFSSIFENIKSFEPTKEVTEKLSSLNKKNITIFNCALSDSSGEQEFFIPIMNLPMARKLTLYSHGSLENRDNIIKNGKIEKRLVKINTLDNYSFQNVDLIKIDVEGHESKVIQGSLNTIKNNKPFLIVEIEQRHIKKKINEVFQEIEQLGYDGHYLTNNKLKSINSFSYEADQKPYLSSLSHDKGYINNFIFIPK
jgi:FkbM family methyltransferase